ncbi:Cyclin protein [Cooperia oncophora]
MISYRSDEGELIDTAARLKPPPLDISYVNTKNNMIKAERRLLATLGFVVHVKHPHKLICAYCFVLRAHHRTDLIQRAWTYMNDGLRTDMFVRYSPETIACACIFLASRTVQPQVPLPDKPRHWYELFDASDTDVHTIAMMLLNMYANQKIEAEQKAAKAQLVAQKLAVEKKKPDDGNRIRLFDEDVIPLRRTDGIKLVEEKVDETIDGTEKGEMIDETINGDGVGVVVKAGIAI